MMEEKRKKGEQQQQHGPAVGARLYFNYTAGCARASSNLVGPLSLSLSLSLSFFLLQSHRSLSSALHPVALVGLFWFRRQPVVYHRNAKKQKKKKNRGVRPTASAHPSTTLVSLYSLWSFLLFPSSSLQEREFLRERKRKGREFFSKEDRNDEGRGIVKVDDESSLDPFEISKIKFLCQINRIYLAFSFKRIPSIPFFCQNFNRIIERRINHPCKLRDRILDSCTFVQENSFHSFLLPKFQSN